MLLRHPATVGDIKQVITIGSPWLGAPKAINAMYTGAFLEGSYGYQELKKLVEFFPGIHILLPSLYLFSGSQLNARIGSPMQIGSWNNHGFTTVHNLTYPEFVAELDSSFRSAPGTTSKTFHALPQQDDWAGDATGLPYTHFVGQGSKAKTIVQVQRNTKDWLDPVGNVVRTVTDYDVVFGGGDDTVPTLSAARPVAMRAPTSLVRLISGPNDLVNHVALTHHPTVESEILSLITAATSPTSIRHPSLLSLENPTEDELLLGTERARYLTLSGVGPIVISDPNGNTTLPDLVNGEPRSVPGATMDAIGENSWSVILDPTSAYRIDFQSDGTPFGISDVVGLTNIQPETAIRFNDIVIPAGKNARLDFGGNSSPELRYDADGDGTFETMVPPTVVVPSAFVLDVTPPEITIVGECHRSRWRRAADDLLLARRDDVSNCHGSRDRRCVGGDECFRVRRRSSRKSLEHCRIPFALPTHDSDLRRSGDFRVRRTAHAGSAAGHKHGPRSRS